jgi:4-amino-4-deoxy-L-arabinose transferase-like glycosyltransferase
LGFIFFKIPQLNLPYYGDEGFAFGPAVHKMYTDGPGLLPSALPPNYSYGHPLLFHFLASSWMHVLDNSIAGSKSFALFLAVLLLISTYYITQKWFDKNTGLLAATLLMLQPVFIAQSGFLLLEIMVALLGIWTIHFWFKRNFWMYALASSMLIMTKESWLFLIFALGLWQLIEFFILKTDKITWWLFIKRYLIMAMPAYVFGAFLLIQKATWGWYLYPLRMEDMNTDPHTLNHLAWWTKQIIFFLHGRIYITLALITGILLYFIIPDQRFSKKQWAYLLFMLMFIFVFKLISILNFISNRYFLVVITVLIIISSAMLIGSLKNKKLLMALAAGLVIFSQVMFAGIRKSSGDDSLGAIDNIRVHQETVRFMEDLNAFDDRVFTHFLMRENLYRPVIGYLSGERIFTNVAGSFNENVKYVIVTSLELWETESARKDDRLRLIKRFEHHNAWAEIYINKSFETTEQINAAKE